MRTKVKKGQMRTKVKKGQVTSTNLLTILSKWALLKNIVIQIIKGKI